MATAAAVGSPSDTECSICHEFFTEPKLLPCAHLLCRKCLVRWMKTEKDALCPLCRAAIVDPKKKKSHKTEDLADTFPTDYSMVGLVDATKLLSQPYVCKVCVDVSASSLCLDCGDMLCSKCCAVHEKLSATSHHSVEKLSSLTAQQVAVKRPVTCVGHTNRPSEFYCQGHDVYLCFFCAKKTHHDCKNIQTVEDLKDEQREMALTLMMTLSSEGNRLTKVVDQLDQCLAKLNAFEESAMSRIQGARESLMRSVATCCDCLEQKVTDASTELKAKVDADKKLFLQDRRKLARQKVRVQEVQESLSGNNLSGATLSLKRISHDFDKHAQRTLLENTMSMMRNLTFTVNQTVLHKIREDLKKIGKIEEEVVFESLQSRKKTTSPKKKKADVPQFHTCHGRNIALSTDRQTARRICGDGGGVIFSSSPMVPNKLYEVQIDEVDESYRGHTIYFGVYMKALTDLIIPDWSGDLKSAIVISPGWVRGPDGEDMHINQFSYALGGIGVGHRVGLAIHAVSNEQLLYLYVDGKCQGNFAKLNSTSSCSVSVMFDLMAYWKQVTILPLKNV